VVQVVPLCLLLLTYLVPHKELFLIEVFPPLPANTYTLHAGIVLVYQQGLINTPYRYPLYVHN
jgi:hypothetical protein